MSRIDYEDQARLGRAITPPQDYCPDAVVTVDMDGVPQSPPAFPTPGQHVGGVVVLRPPHPAMAASLLSQALADLAAAHMLIRTLIADHRQETSDLKARIEDQRRTLEARAPTPRTADPVAWVQPNPLPRGVR